MEFNDFIFPERLKEQLEFILDNTSKIPRSLCFYGLPAKGKTSFAKFLGGKLANEVSYHDCTNYKKDEKFHKSIDMESYTFFRSGANESEDGLFTKCIILDEWQVLPPKIQDSFKTVFEDGNKKCIFIICCNTSIKKPLYNVLSPSIQSRCHKVRFDLFARDLDEVIEKTKDKFPMLDDTFIRNNILDYRAITREVNMKAVPEEIIL